MTSSSVSSQQNQQAMMSAPAVVAKSTGGIVQHGIATSVALPFSQQPIGVTNVTDGVATPPPPSYEFSMQQKQQQQRTSPVIGARQPVHIPSPATVSRGIQ